SAAAVLDTAGHSPPGPPKLP
ncbi:hypothetical protein CDAR_211191, partial [Caerostris darwini]